jgi:glycosyltransferase involved in cell wall biosynthesis
MEPRFALFFEGRLSSELRSTGAPLEILGPARVRWLWTIFRARRKLRRILEQDAIDAVVAHGCWPHAILAASVRRVGRALVFWAHGRPSGRHWLERWARQTPPDLVLAISGYVAAGMDNLFPGIPVEVLHGPVHAAQTGEREATRQHVRSALGTSDRAVVIVMASRIERLKGHHLLIDALRLLRDDPRWVAWIAGGPQRRQEVSLFEEIQCAARQGGVIDRVRFLGQRSDVRELLAAADVYCQPNAGPESFPVAFIEALSASLPVVSTAMGGAPEIVDETCGLLVPPANPDTLSTVLRRLIADRPTRMRLGAHGPERARVLCGPSERIRDLGHVISRCVPGESIHTVDACTWDSHCAG